jgi:myo-inositol-1(or 4)-monophosphatase
MHPIINIAKRAVKKAETAIIRSLDRLHELEVARKAPHDFVTEMDKKAEQEIISVIQKAYPDHQIIAEESGLHDGQSDYVWLIDPIDGTHNFFRGVPHFCISIAFLERGVIQHGLISDPIRNETFFASRGQGARLNEKRLRVSTVRKLDEALIGMGFPVRHPEKLPRSTHVFQSLLPNISNTRCSGSAALDLAYVAAGRLDAFLEDDLKPWDLAAGALLVKEAGGLVCDWEGTENYLEKGNVIASTPKILNALLPKIIHSH